MWIARDENGTLNLFLNDKPIKCDYGWFRPKLNIDSKLFPEVKWEDEEPTEIEMFIKGTK